MEQIIINGCVFEKIKVELPKTTLYIIKNDKGFLMCGALNVDIYNSEKLKDRHVLCASVINVKSFDDMLNGVLNNVSDSFVEMGAYKGMKVKDALYLLS